MEKPFIIFISSTIEDMQEERNAVTEVANSLKMLITRSEFFDARKESPKKACLDEVRKCDVFIGIYKKRYGFVPEDDNPEGFSVTQMEYLEAKNSNREISIFISEDLINREERLTSFLEKIRNFTKGHFVKKFHCNEELKYLTLQALYSLKNKIDLKPNEELSLRELVPDIVKYQKSLLTQVGSNTLRGIARNYNIISYKVDDLFVAPELMYDYEKSKIEDIDRLFLTQNTSIALYDSDYSWDEFKEFIKQKNQNKSITTGIDIKQKLQENKPIVILGDPGSGKSTLLKFLTYDMIVNTPIIPIFIRIRDFAQYVKNTNDESIINYLEKQYEDLGCGRGFFLTQLKSGSCLIVFDGLDEIWNNEERNRVNKIFEKFLATWNSENKIIISSRITGYTQNPLDAQLEILKIGQFKPEQIKKFILKWVELVEKSKKTEFDDEFIRKTSTAIFSAINFSGLYELARNPLLLLIICLIYSQNLSLPTSKNDLYHTLIETLLSTWEKSKGLNLQKYGWRDFESLFQEIGFWLFNEKRTEINKNELFNLIKKKLNEDGLTDFNNNDIEEIINHIEERTGILIYDGFAYFSFYHLSFLEFFIALKLSVEDNVKTIFDYFTDRLHDPKNSEIISFLTANFNNRIKTSNFLNLILNANTKYEEIHLLDLSLVLNSIASGAVITDDFSKNIIQILESKWNKERLIDRNLFFIMGKLLNTNLRKQLTEIWRRKCLENPSEFVENSLSRILLSQKENFDVFKKFWDDLPVLNSKHNKKGDFIIFSIFKNNPHTNFINFIKENWSDQRLTRLYNLIIPELAQLASHDKELEKWYFDEIDRSNDDLKITLIQFAPIVNMIESEKVFQDTLQNSKSQEVIQILNNLKLKNQNRTKKQIKFIERESQSKPDIDRQDIIGNWIRKQIDHRKFDHDFIEYLIELLGKISIENEVLVFRICLAMESLLKITTDYNDTIKKMVDSCEEKYSRWQRHFQNLKLVFYPTNEGSKKILMENVLDKKLFSSERRFCHSDLYASFKQDSELKKFNESLILDAEVGVNALSKIDDNEQLISLKEKFASICVNSELSSEIRRASVRALQRAVIASHST